MQAPQVEAPPAFQALAPEQLRYGANITLARPASSETETLTVLVNHPYPLDLDSFGVAVGKAYEDASWCKVATRVGRGFAQLVVTLPKKEEWDWVPQRTNIMGLLADAVLARGQLRGQPHVTIVFPYGAMLADAFGQVSQQKAYEFLGVLGMRLERVVEGMRYAGGNVDDKCSIRLEFIR